MQADSKFIDALGMRTHYFEAGSGFPVVLLHSGEFGGAAELSWEFTLPALAQHFRVIAPDWLGFGQSAKIFSFDNMVDLRLRHMAAFVETLGLSQAHFIGNSMGGSLLCNATAREASAFPVERMILVGAGGSPLQNAARNVIYAYDGTREHMKRMVETLILSPLRHDDAYIDRRHRISLEPGAWECTAAARFRRSGVSPQEKETSDYSKIRFPTLIVAGAEDPLRNPGFGKDLQARIAGSELAVFEGAGHFPHIDMPERFNRLAVEFLSR